ncbi:hypothetical protein AAFA46_08435 [Oscillospiraceae bacterium WX1]
MKGSIKLNKSIIINGKEVKELTYDTSEITAIDFVTAESKRKAAAGIKNTSIAPAAEFDFGLHIYLGFAAITAVNHEIDLSDLERIKGHDIVSVMAVGRNFILKSEGLLENSSAEQFETTPESSTQA